MSTTPNPSYFRKVACDSWSIVGYLDHCFRLQSSIPEHEYHKAFNRWRPALKHLADDPEPKTASAAQSLALQFPQDRVCARNWFSKRKASSKLHRRYGNNRNKITIKRTIQSPGTVNLINPSQECSPTMILGAVNTVNSGLFLNPVLDQRSSSSGESYTLPISHHHRTATESRDNPPDPVPPPVVIHGNVQALNSGTFVNPLLDQRNDRYSEYEFPSSPVPYSDASEFLLSSLDNDGSELGSVQKGSSSFAFSETGRVLEEVIRHSDLPTTNIARQGVIDLEDLDVTNLFKPSELTQMIAHIPPEPEADILFMGSMARFARAKTFTDFTNVVENIPYREGEYFHVKHAQAAWVNQVILWMVQLLRSYGDLRSRELTEGWFDSSLWSILVDCCSFSFPWMTLRRKELPSWSLKAVASHSKTDIDESNKSSLFDGIIHDNADPLHREFGLFEVAKCFTTTDSTKWTNDKRKVIIGMHGMARTISRIEPTLPSIQVVGFIHAKLSFMVLIGTSLSPTLTLVSCGKLRTIPATIKTLREIFPVLKSLHLAMKTMDRCRTALARPRECDSGDDSESETEFMRNLHDTGY